MRLEIMKNNWRQVLHLGPQHGWLNDPNGLSFFNGAYHVYFQYSPDSPLGESERCWGHWEGSSLLDWQFRGVVMRPDIPEDRDGVFSGSGIVHEGRLYLFYTGNVLEEGCHDFVTSGRGANVIMVTTDDGQHMSEKRVLLRNSDYPANCSCHVRDPKVWEEDGRFRMVLGARTLDDRGCVLFYRSDDLLNWQFEKQMTKDSFGYMCECPDLIRLGDRRFLGISPQGLEHEEFRCQNVYSSGYLTLDSDIPGIIEEWDYGFDLYAPQTFTAPDGRVILIGWMGIGDIPYSNPTVKLGWQHCLTLPRELTVGKNGKIYQRPIRELNALKQPYLRQIMSFADHREIQTELPFCYVSFAEKERFSLVIEDILEMDYTDGVFTLRFTNEKAGGGRDVRRVRLERLTGIEIVADMSSLEIFLNGGEKVMSTRFYPSDTKLKLRTDSGSIYRLKRMDIRI